MESTLEFIAELNCCAKKMQTLKENEYIKEDLAKYAIKIVREKDVNSFEDVFLKIVSLNLLNTYVKQKDSVIGYGFKSDLIPLIEQASKLNIKNISMFKTNEHGNNVFYITLGCMQFSFHSVSNNLRVPLKYNKEQKFDMIRKHLCALTIFNKTINFLEE